MLPVVAKTYYEIPVYAGLLNLIVVPGMTVVVAGSWFGLLVSIGTISLGRFVIFAGWVDVTGIYMALRKDTGTAVEYTCYRRDTRLADWHVVWRDCMHAGIASHKNKK